MNNPSDDLKKLRRLILQNDEEKIFELEKELNILRNRINDTDEWLAKLDPVIAEALARKISESREEMAEALAPVMGEAIRTQIKDAKEDMVDALYPVIGSTIRKSVAEAMKNLVRAINEKIDRALSFQSLFRRLKSRVTGVSEGELLLKEALPFQVHEIFLIHKPTGLLLSHVSQSGASPTFNQDMISGMLTAIRDFAKTAFRKNGDRELSEITYEDLQIYLEDGRHAYLAVVVSNMAPHDFAERLRKCEDQIHKRFHKQLRDFDGNLDRFKGAGRILSRLLREYTPAAQKANGRDRGSRSAKGWLYLLVVILLLGSVYLGLFWFPNYRAEKKIRGELELLRAREPLLAGPGVQFRVDGKTVTVDGAVASQQAKEQIGQVILAQPSVTRVQNHLRIQSGHFELSQILPLLRIRLAGETTVDLASLRYISDGEVLTVEGQVSSRQEKMLIGQTLAGLISERVILNNLSVVEGAMPARLRNRIETQIHFERNGSDIAVTDLPRLDLVAELLRSYPSQKIYLHGHSDNEGSAAENQSLSERRALRVKDYLVRAGVDPSQIETVGWGAEKPIASNETPEGRARNRRVEISFSPEQ